MARRLIENVRTSRDPITEYLKEYRDRLNTGAIENTDSLTFMVNLLEYIAYREYLRCGGLGRKVGESYPAGLRPSFARPIRTPRKPRSEGTVCSGWFPMVALWFIIS